MTTESVSESKSNINLLDPDVRLMLAVQQDDAVAFEELMLRYQGRIFTLLRHAVNDRNIAEDLTQDVFLRVFRARKNYQPDAKFSTWLFTIANNVALNAIRSKSRKPEVQIGVACNDASKSNPVIFAEDTIAASSGTMPTRQLEKLEMRQMVQLAVNALGDRQRMAVLLHKFEGMSYIEISKIMDMSPQALKSLLCRARLNLREILQAYMKHGDKVKEKR
ncbi:MAG: sigma-70 family RNA polymerase sigma factor [Planctomycetaceae bacterium]|jgi:RNA polymerase sigma-70 factor (ECF subfamily)|nr:sigma-70 family RNA polymerase sigma factor [Planctomycetaceae bacterium]